MPRIRFTTEQIINKLRQAEVLISQGRSIGEVAKELAISDHTYYRWRREYGGIRTEQAKRLKMLEKQNDRLKKLAADLPLDNANLKDAAEGNFQALHDAGQQLKELWNGTRFLNDEHVGCWASNGRPNDIK